MRIIIPLDIEKITYDCSKCGGWCCSNIVTSLAFDEEQMQDLKNTKSYKAYSSCFYKSDKTYHIKVPKKCWFQGRKGCVIGNNRSYDCMLYPVYPFKLNENIMIAMLRLCPFMTDTDKESYSSFNSEEVLKLIKKSEKLAHRESYSEPYIKSTEDIEKSIEEKLKIVENATLMYKTDRDMLIAAFYQLLFVPPLLFLGNDEIEQIKEVYIYYMQKLLENDVTGNIQNMQMFLENKILRYGLYQYYIPANMRIYSDLNNDERSKLHNFENKHILDRDIIPILQKYRGDNSTIWEKWK